MIWDQISEIRRFISPYPLTEKGLHCDPGCRWKRICEMGLQIKKVHLLMQPCLEKDLNEFNASFSQKQDSPYTHTPSNFGG